MDGWKTILSFWERLWWSISGAMEVLVLCLSRKVFLCWGEPWEYLELKGSFWKRMLPNSLYFLFFWIRIAIISKEKNPLDQFAQILLTKLYCFTNLDFPDIRGFPFLATFWGEVMWGGYDLTRFYTTIPCSMASKLFHQTSTSQSTYVYTSNIVRIHTHVFYKYILIYIYT